MYKQVKINITPEHHHDLSLKAMAKELSLAQYIRQELNIDLKNAPKRTVRIKSDNIIVHKVDDRLLYHLSKIGTNLNQIAKRINMNSYDCKSILIELIKIQKSCDDYKCK